MKIKIKNSSKKAFNHKHSSKIPPRSQLFSLLIGNEVDRRLTESVEILANLQSLEVEA
jgi:hypothetical protein